MYHGGRASRFAAAAFLLEAADKIPHQRLGDEKNIS
jgi:hypothetical protein